MAVSMAGREKAEHTHTRLRKAQEGRCEKVETGEPQQLAKEAGHQRRREDEVQAVGYANM